MASRQENELVRANLGLVVSIARRFGTLGEREDLIAEGAIGLLRAIRTYDGERSWPTWAAVNIRWAIIRSIPRCRPEILSLDAPRESEEGESSILDRIGDDRYCPERPVLDFIELEAVFEEIPEADRPIIAARLDGASLEAIAEEFGFASKQAAKNRIIRQVRRLIARGDLWSPTLARDPRTRDLVGAQN